MEMSEQDTFEKVKSIVVEQLGVDEKEVKMDAAYIDDLGADSLDIVELIMLSKKNSISKSLMMLPKKSKLSKIQLITLKRKRKRKYAIRARRGRHVACLPLPVS